MIAASGAVVPVPGSFRDPSGAVFERDGRIFRTVNSVASRDFDFVRQTPFYDAAVRDGRLVEARLLSAAEAHEIVIGHCVVVSSVGTHARRDVRSDGGLGVSTVATSQIVQNLLERE